MSRIICRIKMAEYKRQTILTMVMAGVVGISLIVGVLFLPTASNAPTATAGACAIPFPSISEFFPNPNDTQTTFANGTVLDRAWMEVLLMPANSSGQLCVLYSHFPNYPAKSYTIQPLIQHVRVSLMQTSATLPTISAYPSNFTLIDNENASVAFSVQAPQGSRGIYSLYIPGILPPPCIPPPLVVGYSLSE